MELIVGGGFSTPPFLQKYQVTHSYYSSLITVACQTFALDAASSETSP